jgi:predicted small secreted protein
MLKRIILAATLVVLILILLGCNTVEGMGKDIEWTGQKGAEILGGK